MNDFNMDKAGFETLALHYGQKIDESMSRGVPVHRTSSYLFKSTKHAADLFAAKEFGNIYSRIMNPTNDVLEQRITALEGGATSVAVSSGTSAIFYAIINLAKAGDEIVSAKNLYGGTFTMFEAILPDLGINVKFADHKDPSSFDKLITSKTRALFIETIGNPVLDFTDIEAVSAVAKKHHLPLIVDATFTTPYLLQSIKHGADIVINSLTKWIGGHGTAIGGIMTDAGNFDWSDKNFSLYNEPDKNYHGWRWAIDLPEGLKKILYAVRFRFVPLRNLGACLSPDNAWMFLQGTETLHIRMPRHCENALAVAKYLKSHSKTAWVRYPGLPDDPTYPTASKYLKKGYGGMVVFGVKGGVKEGEHLIDSLGLFSHLANVGDAKSLALHPASTSHSQLSEEQQLEGGLTPDLVRLSIGLENIDDIIADLDQALSKI